MRILKFDEFQLSSKFNVGLIGAGAISEIHMAAYKSLQNVKVVAICDMIEEKARSLAKKWGVEKTFTRYEDLFEINDLDVVDICTPTPAHASIACDAASYGHDILLEKPMALSVAQCDAILKEVKKHNVNLCVNHHALYYSSIRKAKSLLDSGFYDLKSFRISGKGSKMSQPKWSLKPENGGLLWEMGTHGVYLAQFFLPEITEVFAIGNASENSLLYDNFSVLLRTRDDTFGIMDYSITSNQREYLCEITGSDGRRALINLRHDVLIDKTKYRPKWYYDFWYEGTDLLRSWTKWAVRTVTSRKKGVEFMRSKLRLMGSYLKSIEENKSPPVTPEEGRDAIKLLECIKKSIDTNKVVPVS